MKDLNPVLRWTGHNMKEMAEFTGSIVSSSGGGMNKPTCVIAEHNLVVKYGDHIMQGVDDDLELNGKFYVIPKEVFDYVLERIDFNHDCDDKLLRDTVAATEAEGFSTRNMFFI